MTLVDTSAWIDFFRGISPLAERVDELLADGELAICGPVITELRRGLRTPGQRKRVLSSIGGCHLLDTPGVLWEEAGELGAVLGRKGAIVKSMDLLIATYALSHDVSLLTGDSDFEVMHRAGIPLQLV